MPKKTKKAKLIAEYRRKLQQLEGHPIQSTTNPSPEPVSSISYSGYTLPKTVSKQESPSSVTLALPINEFTGIKKDLIKTLIVICLFFSVEFALWKLFG